MRCCVTRTLISYTCNGTISYHVTTAFMMLMPFTDGVISRATDSMQTHTNLSVPHTLLEDPDSAVRDHVWFSRLWFSSLFLSL